MSKAVRPVDDGIALLSVHDVCLAYEDDFIALYDQIRELGVDDFTVLVTPFHGMKLAKRIDRGMMFVEFLKSLGLELSLHGYYHQSKSGDMDEFRGLTTDRIRSRILSGFSLLQRTFGKKPLGFIPPSWSGPKKIADICTELGLRYCVLGNHIHNLRTSGSFTTTGSLISEGQGSLRVGDVMVEMEIGGPLQVALHPRDYRHEQPFEILTDLKDRLNYRFVSYADFIKSKM
jgi:predicted deacetylase